MTNIGDSAFASCSSLTSVSFGENSQLTSIGDEAFSVCNGLTSVEFPNSVISIGNGVFDWCSSLLSIKIGNRVTNIGSFSVCESLEEIIVSEGNTVYCSQDGILYNKETREILHIPTKISGDVIILNGVTSIDNRTFENNTGLTSIEIPDSVTSIGEWAFAYCSSLTSIVFGENSQLTSIGEWAFNYCNSLTSVVIPDSVTSVGNNAFSECNSLTSVDITDIAAWCNINFASWNSNPLSYAHNLYLSGELMTEIEIPNGVTCIGNYAFYGCSNLTSIEIPDSVTSIGEWAFFKCSNLTSGKFAENSQLTSIGDHAFSRHRDTMKNQIILKKSLQLVA